MGRIVVGVDEGFLLDGEFVDPSRQDFVVVYRIEREEDAFEIGLFEIALVVD